MLNILNDLLGFKQFQLVSSINVLLRETLKQQLQMPKVGQSASLFLGFSPKLIGYINIIFSSDLYLRFAAM